jgi:hypothetical protein
VGAADGRQGCSAGRGTGDGGSGAYGARFGHAGRARRDASFRSHTAVSDAAERRRPGTRGEGRHAEAACGVAPRRLTRCGGEQGSRRSTALTAPGLPRCWVGLGCDVTVFVAARLRLGVGVVGVSPEALVVGRGGGGGFVTGFRCARGDQVGAAVCQARRDERSGVRAVARRAGGPAWQARGGRGCSDEFGSRPRRPGRLLLPGGIAVDAGGRGGGVCGGGSCSGWGGARSLSGLKGVACGVGWRGRARRCGRWPPRGLGVIGVVGARRRGRRASSSGGAARVGRG